MADRDDGDTLFDLPLAPEPRGGRERSRAPDARERSRKRNRGRDRDGTDPGGGDPRPRRSPSATGRAQAEDVPQIDWDADDASLPDEDLPDEDLPDEDLPDEERTSGRGVARPGRPGRPGSGAPREAQRPASSGDERTGTGPGARRRTARGGDLPLFGDGEAGAEEPAGEHFAAHAPAAEPAPGHRLDTDGIRERAAGRGDREEDLFGDDRFGETAFGDADPGTSAGRAERGPGELGPSDPRPSDPRPDGVDIEDGEPLLRGRSRGTPEAAAASTGSPSTGSAGAGLRPGAGVAGGTLGPPPGRPAGGAGVPAADRPGPLLDGGKGSGEPPAAPRTDRVDPLLAAAPADDDAGIGAGAGAGAGADSETSREEAPIRPRPAPFGHRVAAALLDGGLLLVASAAVIVGAHLLGVRWNGEDLPALGLFLLVFSFAYSVVPLAFWGRTPGMALTRILARGADGGPLTFGQTAVRWLGGLLTLALAGLPLLLALPPFGSRSLADRLSGSRTWLPHS